MDFRATKKYKKGKWLGDVKVGHDASEDFQEVQRRCKRISEGLRYFSRDPR